MEELKTQIEKQNEIINLQGRRIKQQARKISRIQESILEIIRSVYDRKQDSHFQYNLMKCNEINTKVLLSDSDSDCEPETRTCDDCGCIVLTRRYLTKVNHRKYCGGCICDNVVDSESYKGSDSGGSYNDASYNDSNDAQSVNDSESDNDSESIIDV